MCATPQLINFLKPGSILLLIGYTSQKEGLGLGCVPEDISSHLQLKKYLIRYVQYVCVQTEKYNGPLKGLAMLQCEGARETIYFGIEYVRVHQSEGCAHPVFMLDISPVLTLIPESCIFDNRANSSLEFCLYHVSSRVNRRGGN